MKITRLLPLISLSVSILLLFVLGITFARAACVDSGLRIYNGKKTVFIAGQKPGSVTSPLRIKEGSGIYGLVLVNPGDPTDSGVRIKTSSGIKALGDCPSTSTCNGTGGNWVCSQNSCGGASCGITSDCKNSPLPFGCNSCHQCVPGGTGVSCS